MRAAPSRTNSNLVGERTFREAALRTACGVGLLAEVQEVACLGVY